MALLIYSTLFRLLLPFLALRLLLRSRKAPTYRQRMLERLGFGSAVAGRPLWVHAVSVGEVIAISPLIERLLSLHPQLPILVTTMTPTGAAQVEQRFASRVSHRFIPWDTPGSVRRFLAKHKPRAGVIVETELWPNLLNEGRRAQIPLILVNARLSAKSLRGYQRFSGLTKIALSSLTHICAQHQDDADRFRSLGMPAERISVDGSIKYDLTIPRASTAQGESWRAALGIERPVLIAASTHQGEDQVALEAWSRLHKALADVVLIIVPRHPERFDSVFKLAQQFSAHVERRASELPPSRETQIWVGDSLGEMLAYYAAADLAFVGGSFSGTGGHNPLEPAALGKPIIMGPSRFNFASISSELEAEGALFEAKDSSELADTALALFTDAGSAGVAAKQVVERNRGALDRVQAQVERCLQC